MNSVLVADRDLASVEAVLRAAGRAGLQVTVAESGIEALERYRADGPRIVFVDRLLPLLDGPHVAQKIRDTAAGQATAVILTGVVLGADARLLRERYHFSDVLAKPFGAEDAFRAMLPFLPAKDEPSARARAGAAVDSLPVEERPFARLLADIVAHRRTGEATWSEGGLVKSAFFADGMLVGGRSNGRIDRWPAWAARDPLLAPEARSRLAALGVPGPGPEGWTLYVRDRVGLDREEYRASRARWAVALLLELLATRCGRTAFLESAAPPEPMPAFDVRGLVLGGLRQLPGESFEPLLPRSACRLRRSAGEVRPDELGLVQVEQELLGLVDGTKTVGELLGLGRLIQHEIRPFLHTILALGIAEAVPAPPARVVPADDARLETIGPGGPARGGDLGEASLLRVLAALHGGDRTGILQTRREETQYSFHLEMGEVVFARSNRPEHRLGRVLLEARMIASEDHRRALALQAVQRDRRIGSILIGLGALTLRELHTGLAAQVRGILHDALAWTDGSYVFIEGELPADDRVSLVPPTGTILLERARSLAAAVVGAPLGPCCRIVARADFSRLRGHAGLSPAEHRVLDAVEGGATTAALETLGGVPARDAHLAFLALAALGWIATAESQPPPAVAAAASAAPAPGDTVPLVAELRAEIAALGAVKADLEARLKAAEAENRRLRRLLTSDATVNVG